MNYLDERTRIKSSNFQSLEDIGVASYVKPPSQYLLKKTSFPQNLDEYLHKRKVTSIIEPLAFASKIKPKKKVNNSKDFSFRSKNSYSNKSFLNQSNSTSKVGYGYLSIKKQNQKLKTQQSILFSRLLQSQRQFDFLQQKYQQKCEQTETLKSIITSLKSYIHKQIAENSEQSSENSLNSIPISPEQEVNKENKRRLSQLNSIKRVSINFNVLLNQVPLLLKTQIQTKFDSFIKKHSTQSIKGSAYELYSFNQMI